METDMDIEMQMEKPDNCCSRHPGEDITFIKNAESDHHYGKWICANPDCNKFVRWAKKPTTTVALQQRQEDIESLLGDLYKRDENDTTYNTMKMIKFMLAIYNTTHLNLVQKGNYDKIRKHLRPWL